MPFFIRQMFKMMSILTGTVLLSSALAVGTVMYYNAPPNKAPPAKEQDESLRFEADGTVYLEVRSGESAMSVGRRLEEAGLIRSRHFWYLLAKLNREYIKTGTYKLELPASQITIHSLLVTGRQLLVRVTIPEGVTLKKMARILEDAEICGADDFLRAAAGQDILNAYRVPGKTMEGYLYPDTYLFSKGLSASQVVRAMADTFWRRTAEIAPEGASLSPEEFNKRVIIASIVEREYRMDEEAALMAGVFYNRLRIGMALQSCATVEYVITEIQGRPHPELLYTKDTEIRDPYNTYIRPGLPPGPISAPGAVALKAAFNPAASDYLYFRLVDPSSGRHYFSGTLDDHIRAGVLYVKGSSLRS